jgi:CIC family chloride channel protein
LEPLRYRLYFRRCWPPPPRPPSPGSSSATVSSTTSPTTHSAALSLAFAVLIGPIVGLLAVGWTRLITAANHARPEGRARYLAPFGAFLVLGLVSLQYPQLLGNGRSIVQLGLVANLSFGLIIVLLLLKPLVTAACVASGAPGGLFTPTFAIGVLMAGACATIWAHIWPGPPVAAYT